LIKGSQISSGAGEERAIAATESARLFDHCSATAITQILASAKSHRSYELRIRTPGRVPLLIAVWAEELHNADSLSGRLWLRFAGAMLTTGGMHERSPDLRDL